MTIKTCGTGGRQRELVPRNVVCVRMRYEAPRLAAPHVDRQLGMRQKQACVVVEQGKFAVSCSVHRTGYKVPSTE